MRIDFLTGKDETIVFMTLRKLVGCRAGMLAVCLLAAFGVLPAGASQGEYVLGAGDKLGIYVFGRKDLSGEHAIRPSGSIALPLLGDVAASERTVTELAKQLEDAYTAAMSSEADLHSDININVEILKYRPFYILGDVAKPGSYPYEGGLTVLRAVALAGGYASSGPSARVEESRARENLEVLLKNYIAGVAREARLIAERDKLDEIPFPSALVEKRDDAFVGEIIDVERQLFQVRRELMSRELDIIRKRETQYGEEDDALRAQLRAVEEKRSRIQDMLRNIETLVSQGVMPESERFTFLIMEADVERESREILVSRTRAKQGISAMEQEALILVGERRREIASQLEEVRLGLAETLVRLKAEADRLAILEVRTVTEADAPERRGRAGPQITRETSRGNMVLDATGNTPILPGDVVMIPHQQGEVLLSVPDRVEDPRARSAPEAGEM